MQMYIHTHPRRHDRPWRRAGRRSAGATLAALMVQLVLVARPAAALLPPGLTLNASSPTSVGLQIWANANLVGAITPTGTITFNAFAPDDTTCSSTIFTSAVPAGTSVNSARFTTTKAGTYRWVASYSGDATYFPATTSCGQPASTVSVGKASTVINIAAPAPVGTTIHGRATLAGGYSPTGTVSFSLAPPGDTFCSAPPVFGSTVAVNGNGAYDSAPFTATQAGSYKWRVSYGGDANNLGAGPTACLDANAAVVVTINPPPAGTGIAVFRPSDGSWYVQGQPSVQWGTSGDVPVPADYNGDGKSDVAVFRPSTGQWLVQGQPTGVWGVAGDVPVPADYNGDGKADAAVYRPSTGQWFLQGQQPTVWGVAGDVPVPADYNGDGQADIAVYRPSTGQWFIRSSVTGGGTVTLWGVSGDVPVAGDYDGDGRTDIAVYRRSTGQWFVRSSVTGGGTITLWGISGDVPVPADYGVDGKADIGIFRPSTGTWFIQGRPTTVWGYATDIPLPLPAAVRMAFFGSSSQLDAALGDASARPVTLEPWGSTQTVRAVNANA